MRRPSPFDIDVPNQPPVRVVAVGKSAGLDSFQVDARFSLRRGEGAGEAVLPGVGGAHQRVIIEHVTVAASLPPGQGAVAYIKIGEIEHALVLTAQAGWSGSPRFRASQPIRLYTIGGGDGIGFAGVERSRSTGSASFYFTVSGQLVSLP